MWAGGREPLEVEQSVDVEGATRLRLLGELDLSVSEDLAERLRELRRAGENVRLDLSELEFIDSSGIRTLVMELREARQHGSRLEVAREVAPGVQKLVRILGVGFVLWPDCAGKT
jgi:anti-anti-sigma factor